MKTVLVAAYVVGLILELIGIYRMAHVYLSSSSWTSHLKVLLSALFWGSTARGAAVRTTRAPTAAEVIKVNMAGTQGLALIALGFIVQALVSIYTLAVGPY